MVKWKEVAIWAFRGVVGVALFMLANIMDSYSELQASIKEVEERTTVIERYISRSQLNQENLKELILRVDSKVDKIDAKLERQK